ncbi:MAG: VCBS repeat-containing protein [Lentisphaerae bacterium]|nr:VCBS repeat-containing protein [Lentisphaerota bacterium]
MKPSWQVVIQLGRAGRRCRLLALVASVLISAGISGQAQSFTAQTNMALTGVSFGAVAWGDYDRDGNLDFMLSGDSALSGQSRGYVTELYRNTGGNQFELQINSPFSGGYFPDLAWGDFNADGYLDMLIASALPPALPLSTVWQNGGNNSFSKQTNAVLTGVDFASGAWGDYDNDGHPDLLLTGYTGVSDALPVSTVYRNNGDGTFTAQAGIVLAGVESSAVAWGDYDNDSDLDILLTGAGALASVSKVYRNNGDGTFTDQANIVLTGVSVSAAAWGDYDNDGRLDMLIVGSGNAPNYTATTKVYRNNGNGTFSDQAGIALPGLSSPSAGWGDFDNDGRLDILIAGVGAAPAFSPVTKVYRNAGNNTFTEQVDALQPAAGYHFASAAWGDYDHDGRLDILVAGLDGTTSTTVTKVYRNGYAVANTPPTAPTGLTVASASIGVRLSWQPATDAQTPAPGLSYNLRVGTAPGLDNVVPCMADTITGLRRLPALGNMNANHAWTLRNLNPTTTYYWSVQAIDTAFAGGAWSTESSFRGADIIGLRRLMQPNFDSHAAADLGVFYPLTGNWYMRQSGDGAMFSGGPVNFGAGSASVPVPEDYDGDGKADFAVYTPSSGQWRILRSSDGLTTAIAWGWSAAVPVSADYDGDGRADAAVYSAGQWYIQQSHNNLIMGGAAIGWGWNEAIPVPGDYDGDNKSDLAVYYPAQGLWYVRQSSNGQMLGGAPIGWGWSSALPVQGDYDGDGKTDLAVYSPGDGRWYIRASSTGGSLPGSPFSWGAPAAMPVPNDYDGDRKTDIAVYVSSNTKWYIRKSSDGSLLGGGNSVHDGIAWGHRVVTPANAQYQTLKSLGLLK